MSDIELVIKIDEKLYKDIYSDAEIMIYGGMRSGKTLLATLLRAIRKGMLLPKGHGKLKDENEIVKAIQDRVEFLRKNDAIFMRLRKDIDILGCIPKIRCEVPTIIEADKAESEEI